MTANGIAPHRLLKAKKNQEKKPPTLRPCQRLAMATGGVGAFVLALSIWECTTALHQLTGMPWVLAAMLAVGIDVQMVVSELASVTSREDSTARSYAEAYIKLAVGLSVVLNAAAAAYHAVANEAQWLILVALPVGGVVPICVYIAGRTAGALWTGK